MRKNNHKIMIFLSVLVLMAFTIDSVHSRGRGGGNRSHASRSGPAHTGSMNSSRAYKSDPGSKTRTSNQGTRQETQRTTSQDRQTNRGDNRDERYEQRDDTRNDRQDYADDVRDDRQDFYEDNRYGHGRYYYNDDDWLKAFTAGTVIAVGTAVAVSSFQSTSCPSTTTSYNGVDYYKCGNTWYTKGYQSGDVVYIASEPPAGY